MPKLPVLDLDIETVFFCCQSEFQKPARVHPYSHVVRPRTVNDHITSRAMTRDTHKLTETHRRTERRNHRRKYTHRWTTEHYHTRVVSMSHLSRGMSITFARLPQSARQASRILKCFKAIRARRISNLDHVERWKRPCLLLIRVQLMLMDRQQFRP